MDGHFTAIGYKNLIKEFLKSGYSFEPFDGNYSTEGAVYLRHDVDFSVKFAYKMALADHSLGVRSTFFFMPNSELYNLYSKRAFDLVNGISEMGHDVCLHVDADIINDLQAVLTCFKSYYPHSKTTIISFHQPNENTKNCSLPMEIIDVYNPRFVSDIEYASDSGGEWKYGCPLLRTSYKNKGSFQLLTHPLWWMSQGSECDDVVQELVDDIRSNVAQALGQFSFMRSPSYKA